jgi:hypothetical protein
MLIPGQTAFATNAHRYPAPHESNPPILFQRRRSFEGRPKATHRLSAEVLLALALASVGMLCRQLLEPVGRLLCLLIGLLVAAGVSWSHQILFATNARRHPAPTHESNPPGFSQRHQSFEVI